MSNAFVADHFQSHELARQWLEARRWPEGPICAHCGVIGRAYATKKAGLYRCAEPACRKDFSITTGTVMESSHIPLNKWMMAFYLMSSSKKGMSAHQMHRALGVSYKAAWFMCHRIREAMRGESPLGFGPLGGEGKIVEADETYYGPIEKAKVRTKTTRGRAFTKSGKPGPANKRAVVALVERGGSLRSFHVAVADKESVKAIVQENIAKESRLHTDESRLYTDVGTEFADHQTVKHTAGEYVRYTKAKMFPSGEPYVIHTNTIEGAFSIFKRGMKGVYQHCKEKHLHRYLAEFDFRYNHRVGLGCSDIDRTLAAIKGAEGKRLMWRQPD
jgi:transposase-like protein